MFVAGLPAPSSAKSAGYASRRTSPQFVCNGGRNAAYLHGNGTHSEAMLFKGFDGTTFSHSEVLSLLAFCVDCAIILAFYSDCHPLANAIREDESAFQNVETVFCGDWCGASTSMKPWVFVKAEICGFRKVGPALLAAFLLPFLH